MAIEEEILKQVIIHCIGTGDQNLWSILYPYIKEKNYIIDKNIIKHFAMLLNSKGSDSETQSS